jgi:hypothetical protein
MYKTLVWTLVWTVCLWTTVYAGKAKEESNANCKLYGSINLDSLASATVS